MGRRTGPAEGGDVIDIEALEGELERARTTPAASPPATAPRSGAGRLARPAAGAEAPVGEAPAGVAALVARGRFEEAAALVATAGGPEPVRRRDAATWAGMLGVLEGDGEAVRSAAATLREVAAAHGDAEADERQWVQRCWASFDRAGPAERLDVLDHCRERAYRFDDLPWWGLLTLALSVHGHAAEAARAFDETRRLLGPGPGGDRLVVVADLVEAAWLLGDRDRTVAAFGSAVWPTEGMLVAGPAVVCKGSLARYRAMGLAAMGRTDEAATCARAAADAHRAVGAVALLERAHRQAAPAAGTRPAA